MAAKAVATIQAAGAVQSAEKTFWELVEEWLERLAEGKGGIIQKKPKTVATYRESLNEFKIWLDGQGIDVPTRQSIEDYREALGVRRKANDPTKEITLATKNLRITAVRVFFKWLSDTYGLPNLAKGIENLGSEATDLHKRAALNLDEMRRLMETIATADLKGKRKKITKIEAQMIELKRVRDKAIIGVLMATGIRTIELVRLTIGDWKDGGGYSYLNVLGKGRDEKQPVKISYKANQLIKDWLAAREAVDVVSDASPLFCSVAYSSLGNALTTHTISTLCKFYLEKASLKEKASGDAADEKSNGTDKKDDEGNKKPVTAHSLRASLATNAYLNGAKLDQVKQQLRHRNVATTLRYINDAEFMRNPCTEIISAAIF